MLLNRGSLWNEVVQRFRAYITRRLWAHHPLTLLPAFQVAQWQSLAMTVVAAALRMTESVSQFLAPYAESKN